MIIGIVMGLTGAGGALIAIPLFMQFLGMSLKEASFYSLIAVILASLLNYISQRKSTQYRTAILIVTSSSFGSYLTAPLKDKLPTLFIAITLAMVSLYALYGVWIPVKPAVKIQSSIKGNTVLSIAAGLLLGALTTITGLGGGVLMLPLFLGLFKYSHPEAISTSLLAVGFSSLASLLIQVINGSRFKMDLGLFFLMLGVLASVFILQYFVKRLSVSTVKRTRQVVFSFVVVLTLLKLFF